MLEATSSIPLIERGRKRASAALERMVSSHGDELLAVTGVADAILARRLSQEAKQHDAWRGALLKIVIGYVLILAGVGAILHAAFGILMGSGGLGATVVPLIAAAASIGLGVLVRRNGEMTDPPRSEVAHLAMRLYGIGRLGVYRLESPGGEPLLQVFPRSGVHPEIREHSDPRIIDIEIRDEANRPLVVFEDVDMLEQVRLVMGIFAPQATDGDIAAFRKTAAFLSL